ncbi:MAG: hypothetical protein IKT33_00595 [Clostridia bacterium]|nr:hypothetical protein [Clostridia bacterium]
MNNKLKNIDVKKFLSNLKDKVKLSDNMKKKLEDVKKYYIDLGHDLKELGSDVLNGFLHNKFLVGALVFGIIDFSLLGYMSRHDNPTEEKRPLIIKQEAEFTTEGSKPKLVVIDDLIPEGEYVEINKCKDLKKNYYNTLRKVLNSNVYKEGGLFSSEDSAAKDFSKMINVFNENTRDLKYNYAALIQRSMTNVSKEKIQEIICGNVENLNEAENTLAIQLGIYNYLEHQLAVRASGNVNDWKDRDALQYGCGSNFHIYQVPGERYNRTSYKNLMEFGGKGIKDFAKTFACTELGEVCMPEILVMEMLQHNIAYTFLTKLSDRGMDVNAVLKKAQSQMDKTVGRNISEHFDLYALAQWGTPTQFVYNKEK